jgi:hypothetical protein
MYRVVYQFFTRSYTFNCIVLRRAQTWCIIREVRGTLIESWIKDMLMEEGKIKQMQQANLSENTLVDQLLQQLNGGELRTQASDIFSV